MDGSSNTALLIEKSADSANYNPVKSSVATWKYFGVLGGQFAPGFRTNSRSIGPFVADNSDQYIQPWGSVIDRASETNLVGGSGCPYYEISFGSAHPGTVSAVFADGSTHSMSLNTSHVTIQDVCMHDDGYVVDHGDF